MGRIAIRPVNAYENCSVRRSAAGNHLMDRSDVGAGRVSEESALLSPLILAAVPGLSAGSPHAAGSRRAWGGGGRRGKDWRRQEVGHTARLSRASAARFSRTVASSPAPPATKS